MAESGDNASSDGHHWSQERLHADVHRAVGGNLNLLRELSRVSCHLDPLIPAEWMVKRVQFLSYELQSHLAQNSSESERLTALNKFFFESKNFRCVPDLSRLPTLADAYRLSRVLVDRAGAPTVIALLYAFLAERIGLQLEYVDLKPTCFLKWCDHGHNRYIDITRSGSTLSSDELIETLHTRFSMTSFCNLSLLETFSFETYLVDYLTELKRALGPCADPEQLLFVQNVLISYQPSNLYLVGERALLNRRLGNFKSALADLKRYFAFHDRDRAPAELRRLHEELVLLLERHRAQIEVIE